jgi:tocopherol O-methyltransferase
VSEIVAPVPVNPSPLGDRAALISRYFRDTRWQFRYLWGGRRSLALHYGYYDEGVSSHAESLDRLNAVLASRARITAGDLVLDAGCGWGDSSFWINANIGARTFGISIVGEQVARCWQTAVSRGLTDLANFARGDYHRMVFDDASFDVVWAAESVCYSPDKQQVLSEMFRILRPGGRLVLADFARAGRPLPPESEAKLHAWIGRWVVPDLATMDELAQFAAVAGFRDVQVTEETDHIRASAVRLVRMGRRLAPFARAFHQLRLPFYREYAHHNWKSSLEQFEALEAGAWQYAILSAVKPAP